LYYIAARNLPEMNWLKNKKDSVYLTNTKLMLIQP
jgi:hypothetical protein